MEAKGATQMALDYWLWQQHCQGKHPPTIRFYTWSPVAISLGYHQRRWPSFWNELAAAGVVDLVRRPTGGRAVLHQGDLTYMVVVSGMSGKRLEVYEKICEFLIEGWRSIGSAQMRRGDTVLQHGSMRLSSNTELFARVFGEPAPPPVDFPVKQVEEALIGAACLCFGIELVTQPLSEAEWQEIRLLSNRSEVTRQCNNEPQRRRGRREENAGIVKDA
ncbi:MAG: biotin--protein ligase [Cyanobacteria bacterium SW_8_48_13]|nr:MAG: biotin--protein ligase [Cyanobacteria bacterium SW_8_48_13]